MKKTFAVMKGGEVLKKSTQRNSLIPTRDENPGSDIYIWLGRIKINDLGRAEEQFEEIPEEQESDIINGQTGLSF